MLGEEKNLVFQALRLHQTKEADGPSSKWFKGRLTLLYQVCSEQATDKLVLSLC